MSALLAVVGLSSFLIGGNLGRLSTPHPAAVQQPANMATAPTVPAHPASSARREGHGVARQGSAESSDREGPSGSADSDG